VVASSDIKLIRNLIKIYPAVLELKREDGHGQPGKERSIKKL
jgi:hypothetical protein